MLVKSLSSSHRDISYLKNPCNLHLKKNHHFFFKVEDSSVSLEYFFLIGGWFLYNIVLISAIQQCESAISMCVCVCVCVCVCMYPLPLEPPSHTPSSHCFRERWVELPVLYSSFPFAIYCIQGGVYMSMLLSRFIPASIFFVWLPHPKFHQCIVSI